MRTFGKYRLVELLASGGMADVWRAEVAGAAGVVKEVALKRVRGEHGARSDFVRMFIEEARLASRLTHANVVQVFEFDQVDGRYYIAMELVRGRHLGQVVERAREAGVRLGLARAVHACAEVARGLSYAHRLADGGRPLGLVHRDVSPHNVLVSFEGEVKLADFGIARAMSQGGLTDPGTVKGKLAYMAPEQARGAPVDARADVFALGVVLWELCAGRRLFARDSEAATLAAVLEGAAPPPPSAWNDEVPPELDALVLAALEHDPARRTASAGDLATALSRVLLRLARAPEDWDLRALMHRLWPDGTAVPAGPASQPTRVQPVPLAAEPPAGGTGDGAGAAADPEAQAALAAEAAAGAPGGDATAPTRTRIAPSPPARRSRGRRRAALAIASAAAIAGAGAAALRWRPASHAGGTADPGAPGDSPTVDAPGAATPPAAVARAPAPAPGPMPAAPAPTARTSPAIAAPAAPTAAPGEPARPGVLHVTATPWAYVQVDGQGVGETPVTRSLAPGPHRVRVSHPRYGARELIVEIAPGRRTDRHANLTLR
ncbi:serine/threonine protein kinase [Anaeromyxobacter sp. K]|uniref:serine/threonine-protein kinase n=1 Tax=Anaeromyxobacter sp. (strain K) TaxID=447217 RepID=UPI00017BE22E|nr:serine/threonine-protein kinase [Anaeromyxobacter sp. K]ACG72619.1 serine/threonine protein kinase [Anaeromyxobacter sp. K]